MEIGKIKEASEIIEGAYWVDASALDGVRFHVRGLNHPEVMRSLSRLSRECDTQEEADSRVVLEAILLGWDGLTDGGKPYEYSREAAEAMLQSSIFEGAVRAAAFSITKDHSEKVEELVGNLKKPSKSKS